MSLRRIAVSVAAETETGSIVWLYAFGAVVLLLIAIGVPALMYNRLVAERNHVTESWSNIDTELQRRYALIPNLVNTVKGYATHERELLERVTLLREQARSSSGDPASQAADENAFQRVLGQLMARVEAYPQLKADRNFLALQSELAGTENRIQAARRLFNGNVRNYNNKVQVFPSNLLAGAFNFRRATYFELDDPAARGPVDVAF